MLAESIKAFGFNNPVLVDPGLEIIAGHGRVLAASKLGLAEIPTIALPHLSQAQRRAYVLADNKIALHSGWDSSLLAAEIADLSTADFDLALTGFDDIELTRLLKKEPKPGLTDPDAAPAIEDQPFTQLGDVWLLGDHRLMCGDSTVVDQVRTLIGQHGGGGGKVDILITDPPYNVAYEGKTKAALKIKNDAMADDAFRPFLRAAFTAADAVMKPGAAFYIWHADLEGYNFRGACRDVGWTVRQNLVWEKDVFVLGRQDYQWQHEPCLYGWKDGAAHTWASDRKQTTLLKFDRPKRNAEHPTMKPVQLIAYQLLNNTQAGATVLDLFGGSGTTLIAAEQHGRVARLMELDPRYVDVTIRRWQDFTGRIAVRERDGAALPAKGVH